MIITYTPSDAEKREFPFRPRKLPHYEAEAIERKTGWTFAEFAQALPKGSVLAARAALWVLLKREDPALRFDQVAITQEQVEILLEADEAQQVLESIEAEPNLDDDVRAMLMRMLRQQSVPGALPDDDGPPANLDPDDDAGEAPPKDPQSSPSSS